MDKIEISPELYELLDAALPDFAGDRQPQAFSILLDEFVAIGVWLMMNRSDLFTKPDSKEVLRDAAKFYRKQRPKNRAGDNLSTNKEPLRCT